jgi:hypothetical protein
VVQIEREPVAPLSGRQPQPVYLFNALLSRFSKRQPGFAQISTGAIWHPRALMDGFS